MPRRIEVDGQVFGEGNLTSGEGPAVRVGIWGKKPESGSERNQRGTARMGRLRLKFGLAVAIALFAAAPAMATDISTCGVTIRKPGFYQVTQDLSASSGDCLDVNARAIVFLNGHHLRGAGSGVGIRFFPRAKNSFLAGGNATISGFAIGVQDDASNVRGDNFNANGNAGGVLVNGAQSSTFSNFQASNNSSYGVHFSLGANSVAESAQASGNGSYGIWLDGSKGVRIDNFDTEHNAIAGVYIGCASNGPGSSCSGGKRISSANQIYDGFADSNGPYGIAIDTSANANLVTSVEAMNNKTADLLDLNRCGNSSWFGNTYANATPSDCID